ncbi:MAG: CoA ester lyase [Clostridia bacterium]|nr:CoA ester lyase [Clostridia bacterium]
MRSLMFVPSKPKMLGKIELTDADAYIIDLEDSINEKDKYQALKDTCEYLSSKPNKTIYVRVADNHLVEEFSELDKYSFAGYMIPKFENPNEYEQYTPYFNRKKVIALVETPMGMVNIKAIANSSIVSMIAFGAEDFTSSIGMKNCSETVNYARSTLVTYGKAFGKPVIDTPSFIIDDIEELKKEVQTAVDMGFDGKMSIHPKQISIINELFQMYDLNKMQEIVERYEKAGQAVLRVDDKIYEKMHIAHFKRILKEHNINQKEF